MMTSKKTVQFNEKYQVQECVKNKYWIFEERSKTIAIKNKKDEMVIVEIEEYSKKFNELYYSDEAAKKGLSWDEAAVLVCEHFLGANKNAQQK